MTETELWNIIEQSRDGLPPGILDEDIMEQQAAKLATLLKALSPEEIIAFDEVLRKIHRRSDHWDLWGVAYIISGGCSDDAFEYFRRWLLAQGRELFERTVHDPDSLADDIPAGNDYEPEFEEFFYVASDMYEAKTGNDFAEVRLRLEDRENTDGIGSETKGDMWEEDDLSERFPRTWAKFGWPDENT